jgi:hypothetical protein
MTMATSASEVVLQETIPSDFKDIIRYGDPELFSRLGIFLGREVELQQFGVPFILTRPEEETDFTATHDRRVEAVRGWLIESGQVITSTYTQRFGSVRELGLHNDYRRGRWGFNVHTTLEGSGDVLMARYTGPDGKTFSTPANPFLMSSEVPRSLAEAWPDRVDPTLADPVVWRAHLTQGESIIFPVWNETPPEPIGMWHEFMNDTDGRLAVVGNFEFSKQ